MSGRGCSRRRRPTSTSTSTSVRTRGRNWHCKRKYSIIQLPFFSLPFASPLSHSPLPSPFPSLTLLLLPLPSLLHLSPLSLSSFSLSSLLTLLFLSLLHLSLSPLSLSSSPPFLSFTESLPPPPFPPSNHPFTLPLLPSPHYHWGCSKQNNPDSC